MGGKSMTSQGKKEIKEKAYSGIDIERATAAMRRAAIKARCQALEDEGGVFISQDGEMVWETDPKRIFPPGVEVKICECGRVLVVKDEPGDITEQAGG
jgi:hypothetical protein